MKRLALTGIIFLFWKVDAQKDSSFVNRTKPDSAGMNMDAVYNRPFLQFGKVPVALGGYLESDMSYFQTDGVTDGVSFRIPRLTVFMSSTVKNRIRFLTEIEFEEGGKEIGIEFASMDIEFHPLLNLRGGILMNPIGAFNQNHDGPKWEFVDRPISATTIIPSTWSNVGFGFWGKYGTRSLVWGYEAYLTNGFDDKIISNSQNRTWLPATKDNAERFTESFNGAPLITLKTALRLRNFCELGISWAGGVFNKFQEDGLMLDKRRRVDIFATDWSFSIPKLNTVIKGEWIWAWIDTPSSYTQQYGDKQEGGWMDIVQPLIRGKFLAWKNTVLSLALRAEFTDYNKGTFKETGGNISDHVYALSPGISFRFSPQTVIRFNYRRLWTRDLLGNPAAQTGGIQVGFATYF